MGLRFPGQIYGQCFFVTTTFKDWLRYGETNGMYAALAQSLSFCTRKYNGLILGYVFMPSHIHLILYIDGHSLAPFMRDFKKYISQKKSKDLGIQTDTIWMPRYDRVVITSEEILRTKLQYMHNNPVRAKLVDTAQDWPWSSAIDYLSGQERSKLIPVFTDWG